MAGDESQSTTYETVPLERESGRDPLRTTVAELAASNLRLTSYLYDLFENTGFAALFLDRELRIRRFTPAVADVLPLEPSDEGRRLREVAPLLGPLDLITDAREVMLTLDQRERQAWLPERRRWYLVRTLPYRTATGAVDGAVIVFVEISAWKRGQEHAAQLAEVVTSSQDAIYSQGLDMVVTAWNSGAVRLYQFTESEALGRIVEDLIVPPERKGELAPCYRRIGAGELIPPFETVRVAKDGRRLHVLLTLSPLRDSDGTITGVSAIAHDITARQEAEERQRVLAEELAAADRRKDEFLAMLAHELRNPLAPIRHAARILGKAGTDAATVERVGTILERQVQHLSRLVDDLLDVARLVRGQVELRRSPVSLAEVVERAVETAQPDITQRGHRLVVSLPVAPVFVEGDMVRLTQVLGNLLHNAAKYTPAGGRIAVAVERRASDAVIRVTDSGVGVAPEMLPRIFALFEQARSSLDRAEGGLGIGLSLARRLAELHGGGLSARSEGLGRGSEFELRLPAGQAPAPARPTPGPASTGPLRILVVDDNPDVAETLAEVLTLEGHEVAVAGDGLQALDALDRFRPSALLVDIGLPRLDGFDFARRVRQRPDGAGYLLVAVTGYGQASDQRRCLEAGFDHHLTKPVALETLIALLVAPAKNA